MADYTAVDQQHVRYGDNTTTLGTFGVGWCVGFAVVWEDGKVAVGHIDKISVRLLDRFPSGGHATFLETNENHALLRTVMAKVKADTKTVKRSSSLYVKDGVCHVDVGPPMHHDTTASQKLKEELRAKMQESERLYEQHMRGRERPPAPGNDYYWSAEQFKWIPFQ